MKIGYKLIILAVGIYLNLSVQAENFHCPEFAKVFDHIRSVNDSYTVDGLTWYCVPDNCILNDLTKNSDWQTRSSFFKPDSFELILQCTNVDGTYSIVANAGTGYGSCHTNEVKLTPGNVLNCNMEGTQKCPDLQCEKASELTNNFFTILKKIKSLTLRT